MCTGTICFAGRYRAFLPFSPDSFRQKVLGGHGWLLCPRPSCSRDSPCRAHTHKWAADAVQCHSAEGGANHCGKRLIDPPKRRRQHVVYSPPIKPIQGNANAERRGPHAGPPAGRGLGPQHLFTQPRREGSSSAYTTSPPPHPRHLPIPFKAQSRGEGLNESSYPPPVRRCPGPDGRRHRGAPLPAPCRAEICDLVTEWRMRGRLSDAGRRAPQPRRAAQRPTRCSTPPRTAPAGFPFPRPRRPGPCGPSEGAGGAPPSPGGGGGRGPGRDSSVKFGRSSSRQVSPGPGRTARAGPGSAGRPRAGPGATAPAGLEPGACRAL